MRAMPVTKQKLNLLKLAACFKAAQYLPAATQLGGCFTPPHPYSQSYFLGSLCGAEE